MNVFFVMLMSVIPIVACCYEMQGDECYIGDGCIEYTNTKKTIYLDGHLWHPVILEHSEMCDCLYCEEEM